MATNQDAESDEMSDIEQYVDADDEWDSLTEEEIKEFEDDFKKLGTSLSILCCGPTGVGKSTLLNGLMGEDTDEFQVGKSLRRGTSEVTKKVFTKNGIEITLWDTPGLEGCENDEAYLEEIKANCSDHDSFLYCLNSRESRATDLFDEKSSLVKFTKLFGVGLWEKAVVIFTQANGIVADFEEEKELDENFNVEKAFKTRIKKWKKKVREALKKLNVPKNIVKNVPFLPAGTEKILHLPGYEFWLGQVFNSVVSQMTYEAKQKFVTHSRNKIKHESEVDAASIAKEKIEDQPFVLHRKYKVAAGGVGVTAAVVGAGVGATIGALAIGIPTFGVAAGAGLVIGGAVGAMLGGGTSAAFTLAVRHFKKKKKSKK